MGDRRLLVWTLASFHVAGLTLAVVLPAYVSGGLSDVLPEVGTTVGILGYAYLWVLSYLATRWVLTADVFEQVVRKHSAGSLTTVLLRGSAAGGLVGIALLLGPVLLIAIEDLTTGGEVAPLALVAAIGAGVAAVVGVLFGLVFTVLDVGALRVAALFVGPDDTASAAVDSGPVGEQN